MSQPKLTITLTRFDTLDAISVEARTWREGLRRMLHEATREPHALLRTSFDFLDVIQTYDTLAQHMCNEADLGLTASSRFSKTCHVRIERHDL